MVTNATGTGTGTGATIYFNWMWCSLTTLCRRRQNLFHHQRILSGLDINSGTSITTFDKGITIQRYHRNDNDCSSLSHLPNVLIPGTPKGGTTTIADYIRETSKYEWAQYSYCEGYNVKDGQYTKEPQYFYNVHNKYKSSSSNTNTNSNSNSNNTHHKATEMNLFEYQNIFRTCPRSTDTFAVQDDENRNNHKKLIVLDGSTWNMYYPEDVYEMYRKKQVSSSLSAKLCDEVGIGLGLGPRLGVEPGDTSSNSNNNINNNNLVISKQQKHKQQERPYDPIRDLKIIFTLREPVDRELSWYHYRVRRFQDGYEKYYNAIASFGTGRLNQEYTNTTTSASNASSSIPSLLDYVEPVEMSVAKWINSDEAQTEEMDTVVNVNSNSTPQVRKYVIKTFQEEMEDTILKEYTGTGTSSGSGTTGSTAKSTILLGDYAYYLRKWFHLFDRSSQILVLSFDELRNDPVNFLKRIHQFLDIPIPVNETLLSVPHSNSSPNSKKTDNSATSSTTTATMTASTSSNIAAGSTSTTTSNASISKTKYELASRVYNERNEELYRLLEQYPGPAMEQRPFPRFTTVLS